MKGLNSVDETGRKIEDRERQDLSPRYWNFSKRSSKRGIFSIWILFSRINALVFSDWESCRTAARISFVASNALFPSAFEIRAKFESIANRKLVNKYIMCPCTIKKISNSWKKREKREKVEVRRNDMDLRETKRSKHAYARHIMHTRLHSSRTIDPKGSLSSQILVLKKKRA